VAHRHQKRYHNGHLVDPDLKGLLVVKCCDGLAMTKSLLLSSGTVMLCSLLVNFNALLSSAMCVNRSHVTANSCTALAAVDYLFNEPDKI